MQGPPGSQGAAARVEGVMTVQADVVYGRQYILHLALSEVGARYAKLVRVGDGDFADALAANPALALLQPEPVREGIPSLGKWTPVTMNGARAIRRLLREFLQGSAALRRGIPVEVWAYAAYTDTHADYWLNWSPDRRRPT
jgi:hypothetical protein